MGWLKFFGDFDGRIGRKRFWLMSIAVLAVEFVVAMVAAVVAVTLSLGDGWMEIMMTLFLYPQFVINVKRGHDRNISLWVIAIYTILAAAWDQLIRFGWLVRFPAQSVASYKDVTSYIVIIVLGVAGAALFIELGFRRGTTGPNQYGLDPLSKVQA